MGDVGISEFLVFSYICWLLSAVYGVGFWHNISPLGITWGLCVVYFIYFCLVFITISFIYTVIKTAGSIAPLQDLISPILVFIAIIFYSNSEAYK